MRPSNCSSLLVLFLSLTLVLATSADNGVGAGSNRKLVREEILKPQVNHHVVEAKNSDEVLRPTEVSVDPYYNPYGNNGPFGVGSGSATAGPFGSSGSGFGNGGAGSPFGYPGAASGSGVGSASFSNGYFPYGGSSSGFGSGSGSGFRTGYPVYYDGPGPFYGPQYSGRP